MLPGSLNFAAGVVWFPCYYRHVPIGGNCAKPSVYYQSWEKLDAYGSEKLR
jgi:hypothetical protein